MGFVYLRGHWHENRLLRYDPKAGRSEALKAKELPRDERYTVGRWQEVQEGHLFAVYASADGPVFMCNDAFRVPLRAAELEISAGRPRDLLRVAVEGVEVLRVDYTPQWGDNWFDREDFELLYWLVKHYRDDKLIQSYTRTAPSPTWWLWVKDHFEFPPAPRYVDSTGTEPWKGFAALWKNHLSEGLDDDGKDHFNEFTLETVAETTETTLSMRRRIDDAETFAKLRGWAKVHSGLPYALGRAHAALQNEEDPVATLLRMVVHASTATALMRALDELGARRPDPLG